MMIALSVKSRVPNYVKFVNINGERLHKYGKYVKMLS